MQYDKTEIGRISKENGFVRDTFEKVLRLTKILGYINEQDILSSHLLLKGGTAINLAIFNLPRLSVDIDLDYIPNDKKDDMLKFRESIRSIIERYMATEGYTLMVSSRFRKCFTFYTTISADLNDIKSIFDVSAIDALTINKIKRDLFPVINSRHHYNLEFQKAQAKEYISALVELTDSKQEYVERFMSKEYRPELLFDDSDIVARIEKHPMALWKCKK